MVLYSECDDGKFIKLSNVILASNISENLVSSRQFAEAGLGIYLDSQILKIFGAKTHEVYLSGRYSVANYVTSFNVNDECKVEESRYKKYTSTGRIGTFEELFT